MDWAARAAAAPLAGSGAGFGAAAGGPAAHGGYVPGLSEPIESPGAADPGGRTWAAPPPWVAEPEMGSTDAQRPAWSAPPVAERPDEPQQLTVLPDHDEPEADRDYDLSGRGTFPPPRPASWPPGFNPDPASLQAPPEAYPSNEPGSDRENAAAPPLRPIVPQPPGPPPSPPTRPLASAGNPGYEPAPAPARLAPAGPEAWSSPPQSFASMADDVDPAPVELERRSRLSGRPIDAGAPSRFSPQARQPVKKRTDGEWSKPRRFEAYPTLSGRLGSLSPVLVGAFVIAVAALLLFLLPGFLSGGPGPVASRTPAAATATAVPTPSPQPTPETYAVKAGDTLGVIAKSLGRTVEQMACFNSLKNANAISIGQVLQVPPPDYVCPAKPSPTKK